MNLSPLMFLLQEKTAESGPSMLPNLLPFILIIGLFYFLLIRPQSKERRRQEEMRRELKKGDRVLTQGGIVGKVSQVKENEIVLEMEGGAKARLMKAAVVQRLESQEGSATS